MLTDMANAPCNSTSETYDYLCHGMQVSSDIELPGLLRSVSETPSDRISVQMGSFAEIEPLFRKSPEHALTQYKDGCYRLIIPNLGGLSVRRGELIIHPLRADSIQYLLAFLFGTGFAAALAMRGLCPMHISVVSLRGKTLAFGGPSGTGKSTAALWFCQKAGASLMADDVARIDFSSDDQLLFHRGIARVRLWKDSLDASNVNAMAVQPEIWRKPKFAFSLNPAEELTVAAGVLVIPTVRVNEVSEPSLQELRGFEKVRALTESLYRPDLFGLIAGDMALHDFLMRVADRLRVYRFYFSKSFSKMGSEYHYLSARLLDGSIE